ncbi:hypothetical protein [Acinetobacter modestus]|uniref:hypothetical protein n=1 Tax=Acinetobacter modestus TaxID=1776740 RepID=UPI001F4B4C66|nr:hypothetical protein [Acinetobacter modestus]MCH7334659.1 hypothetical protein [Acinetobacter modestus]
MIKKSLCWCLMATSLYLVSGCSEFKNEQALGAETAQAEVEEAMTAASEAEPSADEEVNNNYEDAGDVNPIEQLVEGVPIDVTFPLNTSMSQIHDRLAYDIVIQSKVDRIVINNVTINRGNNCNINDYSRDKFLPANLKFGRYTRLSIDCDVNYIKEVEVETNLGNYKFDQFVQR